MLFASVNWVSEEYGIIHYESDSLYVLQNEVISQRPPSNCHQCAYDSTTTGFCNPPFSFYPKLKFIDIAGRFEIKSLTQLSGVKSSQFKFRIQNLRRHDQGIKSAYKPSGPSDRGLYPVSVA